MLTRSEAKLGLLSSRPEQFLTLLEATQDAHRVHASAAATATSAAATPAAAAALLLLVGLSFNFLLLDLCACVRCSLWLNNILLEYVPCATMVLEYEQATNEKSPESQIMRLIGTSCLILCTK